MLLGVIVGLLLAAPVTLPAVLFVWWVNTGGIRSAIRMARMTRLPVAVGTDDR